MLKELISENLYEWERKFIAPPVQLSITPTNLCNLTCKSCWQRDYDDRGAHPKNKELSEQKLHEIIEEAAALGVRCVELTGGGEPLARKQVTMRLIREIKKYSLA